MNSAVLKLIVSAATFVIAVLGIWAAYKLRKFTKWFDVASAFSAGIILATAYTHMLPESIEQYDHYLIHANAAAAVNSHVATLAPTTVAPEGDASAAAATVDPVKLAATTAAPRAGGCCGGRHHHVHHLADLDNVVLAEDPEDDHHDHGHVHEYPMIPFLAALSFLVLFLVERGAIIFMKNRKNHANHEEEVKMKAHMGEEEGVACESPVHIHDDHAHENAIACCKDINSLEKMSEITAFALIIAVSLHAVIEGMGMGSRKNTDDIITAFIGVGAHKGLEGFAVGANLVESNVTMRRFIMYAGVVSLASPLGALIGYLATLGNQDVDAVRPILGALAVGTFLQVATMEFLPRTFKNPDHFWLKTIGLLVGFGIMCVMPLFVPHEH